MSSHQTSAKLRSSKCRHFCFSFDLHNYCLTCRESGKGDDLCVTNQAPCKICQDLSSEQHAKIKNRRRYTRKVKSDANTSKDDLDLLGDDDESFSGSQADLEGAADTLFSSPPCPQPLRFGALSIKTPHNVTPTPGTVLQNKIENRLEKSLGNTFNIRLKQEMGLFQASLLDATMSLRDEMLAVRNKESDVDKTFDLAHSKPMPGPKHKKHSKPMPGPKHKKHSDKRKHKSKPINKKSQSSAEEDESSAHFRGFTQPHSKVPPEPQPQASSDPVFYREVDMNDLPSQYTEEIETFRQILDLPYPRETMPRSSTTVLVLDDEKSQQELRPRGPSAMLL